MASIILFVKRWTLLCSLIVGTVVYLTFSEIPALSPFGDWAEPKMVSIMPVVIFVILYLTFCKMKVNEMKPRTWHFILQIIRTLLSALFAALAIMTNDPATKIVLEGAFVCFICPTAAAAAVVTDKLGGSIGSMTIYILIANCFTSIIIPGLFPLIERGAGLTFTTAFLLVLRRVLTVLVMPLVCAFLSRRYLPQWVERLKKLSNLPFYLWSFNLSIVMGITVKSIVHASVSGGVLMLLIILPLFICLFQFMVGKAVGHRWGDSITAGQALGQKNTVVGIWLTITSLNPYAVVAPCAYVIWQNIVNAIQLYYKERDGVLRW